MAFSFRRMLSNINYFKKSDDSERLETSSPVESYRTLPSCFTESPNIQINRIEPDSIAKLCTSSLKLPNSVKNYMAKKGSLSDTDILSISEPTKRKRKHKKLKVDIDGCNWSPVKMNNTNTKNTENTPEHVLLDSRSADLFSEHFKENLDETFDILDVTNNIKFDVTDDIFEAYSDDSSICEEEQLNIESLSDRSDTDHSLESESDEEIKMCRKVIPVSETPNNKIIPSASPESFGDVEVDRNEEVRLSMLLNYQEQLQKLNNFLSNLLSEFKFHIEVSKLFRCRSVLTTVPGTHVSNNLKMIGEINIIDKTNREDSPTDSWNIIVENEDIETKTKVRNLMRSMKNVIDDFINEYLKMQKDKISYNSYKVKSQKRLRISNKKKYKHFDFPDLRDAMINLFGPDSEDLDASVNNMTILSDYDEADVSKCVCRCRQHRSPSVQTDSGLTSKNDRSITSQSITSSIGNFSLDTTTLTAYSESLDMIVSYNSFQDTSLYSTLLQKAAIERITFYVQVHSIQLKCEPSDEEFESKNIITFSCPACNSVENEENGLLKHILSQSHCEKIHFLYKKAYIKKCVAAGKEILPSTVLNPMKMYRDDNKIVCFGDAMYACSLCFENLIVGESVLMAHCADKEHVEKKEMLSEVLE